MSKELTTGAQGKVVRDLVEERKKRQRAEDELARLEREVGAIAPNKMNAGKAKDCVYGFAVVALLFGWSSEEVRHNVELAIADVEGARDYE